MKGLFITFEGNEGSGKSTQIALLAKRLQKMGLRVRTLREPGGTPVGEEIRHTLKHSPNNQAMTPEAELLLMTASRAQLVREIIRPALLEGQIVLCDRFYDSTTDYQGHGRGLNLETIADLTNFAVEDTLPDLTLLMLVPESVSQQRREVRQASEPIRRDRMEEADEEFFARVAQGYEAISLAEPTRVRRIDATRPLKEVENEIWEAVNALLKQ
ncbi:MAG TPA: dTMP kinase [Patescibacteria group bacterium]|nr:dTMP kinase [Patescibacteria group bacterium]